MNFVMMKYGVWNVKYDKIPLKWGNKQCESCPDPCEWKNVQQ